MTMNLKDKMNKTLRKIQLRQSAFEVEIEEMIKEFKKKYNLKK